MTYLPSRRLSLYYIVTFDYDWFEVRSEARYLSDLLPQDLLTFGTRPYDYSEAILSGVSISRIDSTWTMIFILTDVAYIIVSLVHRSKVEEYVWVESAIDAKLSAEVRFRLLYIEAELVAGAHSPDPLLADQFRCTIYLLSSEGSLDDLRTKLNLHSFVVHESTNVTMLIPNKEILLSLP